jgi:hypothetical protein
MSSATLYRASGLALLLGALLEIIVAIVRMLLFPNDNPQQAVSMSQQYVSLAWLIVALLNVLSSLLIVGGLPGVCVRQRAQAGWLGLIGFVLTLVSAILFVGIDVIDILVLPYLAATAPHLLAPPASYTTYLLVAVLLVNVGVVLLGLATMRAGVFPRWAGLFLIVAAVINLALFAPFPPRIGNIVGKIAGVLFALGLAWIGATLLAEREAKLVQPHAPPRAGD